MSVVIATYNGAHRLRRLFASLEEMTVPEHLPWEVIVVDNNSHDGTRAIVARLADASPLRVRYVFERKQGVNHARNRGVREAAGEIICFIDDDVVVTRNWLNEVKRAFDLHPVVCIGGNVLLRDTESRPPWWHASYDGVLGKFDGGDAVVFGSRERFTMIGIGANLSFRRDAFERHGLFRPDLDRRGSKLLMGGDTEFYDRLRQQGEWIMYYPTAVVYQCPEPRRFTKHYVRRWHFRIGEWWSLGYRTSRQGPVPMVFGIPRWTCRAAACYAYRALACALRGRRREAFYHQIECITYLGYIAGMLKARLGRRPTAHGPAHGGRVG